MTPSVEGIDVLISEVGPRDGLQNTKQFMPTTFKQRWISAAAAAGLREIEVCSFVPPSIIPQMVDAHEVVRHALGIPRLHVAVLAPNFKEEQVVRDAIACVEAGCDEVGLADTTGMANPTQIRRVFRKVRAAIGDRLGGAHLHNTRGFGLANVVAALEEDVRTFDSSLAGLGGCPFAPGATGNIVTEDLVFMLEEMGLRTGIDLDRLIAIREVLAEGIPGEPLYGHVPMLDASARMPMVSA